MPMAAPMPAAWRMSSSVSIKFSCVTLEGGRRPTTQHELERYAGLFASRTQVMKSSAMRDLMAITERPEVISLAGGLPDTSTFPPGSFAAVMHRMGTERLAAGAAVRAHGGP